MSINLENLSPQELSDLVKQAEQQQKKLHRERRNEVKKKLIAMAQAEGYTIDELFGTGAKKASDKRGTVAPKYRNPANPAQTWSGRGKRPHWFKDALSQGKSENDLLIK